MTLCPKILLTDEPCDRPVCREAGLGLCYDHSLDAGWKAPAPTEEATRKRAIRSRASIESGSARKAAEARNRKLSPERRSEIAKIASRAAARKRFLERERLAGVATGAAFGRALRELERFRRNDRD